MSLRLALDVGGTFTDFAAVDAETGQNWFAKVPSTPDNPSRAILEGTAALLSDIGRTGADVRFFGHSTTVVTNMILERSGARTAMITTQGFRDVLDLGRQARPAVYDYRITRPAPLIARRDRFEIHERIASNGSVLAPLDLAVLDAVSDRIADGGYEAVAVCFLHAYANPQHEIAVRDHLRARMPDVFLSVSHEVAPEYREFERFSTVAVNAHVGPRTKAYFGHLAQGLTDLGITCPLYTVTSNAGLVDIATAIAQPVRTALSGPAAGVAGIGRLLAEQDTGGLITFDVGGTSTDVAIVRGGAPGLARARTVAGHPVLAPMVDIEVIGAGGGSLARLDAGGALTVGPQSAGADPGPVAYGRGGTCPTVTDAALTLGRLGAGVRLAGKYSVDAQAARAAIESLIAAPMGLSVESAAQGILDIAAANMARIIRSVALSRGAEPERMTLVAFGGAGPLLAADVADVLGITRILVPTGPGTLCARAVLVSDIARDLSVTRPLPLSDNGAGRIAETFADMERAGRDWLTAEGIAPGDQRLSRLIEARYAGQNFELAIPADAETPVADLVTRFHATHRAEQGFDLPERAVDAVTLRLKAHATLHAGAAPVATARIGILCEAELTRHHPVSFEGTWQKTGVFQRDALPPGAAITGPGIVEEPTATILIPPGWAGQVSTDGTLVLTRRGEQAT